MWILSLLIASISKQMLQISHSPKISTIEHVLGSLTRRSGGVTKCFERSRNLQSIAFICRSFCAQQQTNCQLPFILKGTVRYVHILYIHWEFIPRQWKYLLRRCSVNIICAESWGFPRTGGIPPPANVANGGVIIMRSSSPQGISPCSHL